MAGQSVSGNFLIEQITAESGEKVVRVLVTGDFSFEQSGPAGPDRVTLFGAVNVSLTFDGDGITNGEGGFVLTSDGIAGILAGDISVVTDGATVGGSIGFRVNTIEDEAHQQIQVGGRALAIDFGLNEIANAAGPFFHVFGAGLSLNIGDFVTIEGNVSFTGDEFAATEVDIFLGQGPAKLEDGSLNPAASGVLLEGGNFSTSTVDQTTTIAGSANIFVGQGPAFVQDQDTGEATDQINPAARGVLIEDAVFEVLKYEDPSDPNYDTVENTAGFAMGAKGTIRLLGVPGVSFTGTVMVGINTTSLPVNEQIELAGELGGNVSVTIPGVGLEGGFALAINNTEAQIIETFTVGDETLTLNLPGGPYLRVEVRSIDKGDAEDTAAALGDMDGDGDGDLDLVVAANGSMNRLWRWAIWTRTAIWTWWSAAACSSWRCPPARISGSKARTCGSRSPARCSRAASPSRRSPRRPSIRSPPRPRPERSSRSSHRKLGCVWATAPTTSSSSATEAGPCSFRPKDSPAGSRQPSS